ncbi:Conserved hypothetical protein [Neorhizobium galegae bv. orientalis]|nr:Conserved hypothetical protein [Neorhizobium galegae bv. orientalis]
MGPDCIGEVVIVVGDRLRHTRAALVLILGVFLAGPTWAQQASTGAEPKDTSGTNPAVLTRSFSISNEYRFLPDDQYFDLLDFRYTEPFLDGRAAVRLTIPFSATDILGGSESGIGDISAKLSWVPYMSRQQAFILSTEVYAPTATEDALGSGKWVIAPGITWAYFASREIIIAPAYIHSFSFAGDASRPDVNRGDFDFYLVYKPHGKRWWITSDFTASHDFAADKNPVSWEVSFGTNLAKLESGAAINGYIRPGIGIGHDRPYDFNIEVGISIVNF